MAEPDDLVLSILREIRVEMKGGLSSVNRRLEKREEAQVAFRHALGADSLLSKMAVGEFEERPERLEKNVSELEKQK